MNPSMQPEKATLSQTDMRIAVAVVICCLCSTILSHFGILFAYGEKHLEILQKMTACISCCLCCQDNLTASKKAGINRIIITAVGGIVAIIAILIDNACGNNEWLMVLLVFIGVAVTLVGCKAAKVPYVNCRIGAVTFILVACTLTGSTRIVYGCLRLISVVFGAAVSALVCWAFDKFAAKKQNA